MQKNFKNEDYVLPKESVLATPKPVLRNDAMPSIFLWTKEPTELSQRRAERARKRRLHNNEDNSRCVDYMVQEDHDIISEDSSEIVIEDDSYVQSEVCIPSDVGCDASDTDCVPGETCTGESEPDTGGEADHEDVLIQSSDMQLLKEPCRHAMTIADYKEDSMKEELHFYTGFDSFNHFMFFFNLLGPAVYSLHYYSSYSVDSNHIPKSLSSEDQFFLTMVKLRRFTLNKELGYRFRVSEYHVTVFFTTWINFLYCQLQEIDTWPSPEMIGNIMNLKGKVCDATSIIDCTEIKIVQPKNPTSQQQTYSHYKGCHTVKVLVAMSPTGSVTFVSEAYGGPISDRELTEKCGFLDKLTSDDVVLADRGFNIQDMLAARNIKIRIPDFVPSGQGQLKPVQTKRSKKIASERIHIERIIGLAKTYNIMKGPLSSS